MPATEAAPPGTPLAGAIDLAALRADLERRGERLDDAAARYLGSALAATLAEAHAVLDAEGNLDPVIHGRLGPRHVGLDAGGAVSVIPPGSGLDGGDPQTPGPAGHDGGDPQTPGPAGDEASAPELLQGGRLTPRADVYGLGTLLAPLFASSPDQHLLAALARATDPAPARRRITCVELEAWLARGADLAAGRRALGDAVSACLDARLPAAAPPPSSRPLSAPARVSVALVTAAAVFAAGVAVAERWVVR